MLALISNFVGDESLLLKIEKKALFALSTQSLIRTFIVITYKDAYTRTRNPISLDQLHILQNFSQWFVISERETLSH